MPTIHLTSFIQAPQDRVFKLCRNLAIRKLAIHGDKAQISASSSEPVLKSGETITFRAKHLGKTREIIARISSVQEPESFTEELVSGDLKAYRHEYHFKPAENGTILIDLLEFDGPKDLPGSIASPFFLRSYLESMLRKKNDLIRQYAETDKWKVLLA